METINEAKVKEEKVLTPEEQKKLAERKAKKLANDKRLKELHKQEAIDRTKKAGEFLKLIKENKMFDKLPPDMQKFVTDLAVPPVTRNVTSVFETLFGTTPKVGDSITLMDVFNKTMKGKAQIDHFIEKKWKPNGIIVEFEPDPVKVNSRYVIKALPNK